MHSPSLWRMLNISFRADLFVMKSFSFCLKNLYFLLAFELGYLFFYLPCNFCWNLDKIHCVIRPGVNRPLVSGFIFIWLAVELFGACCSRRFQRFQIPLVSLFLCLLLSFGFWKISFLNRESCNFLSSNPLLLQRDVVVRTCGEKAFYHLTIKS